MPNVFQIIRERQAKFDLEQSISRGLQQCDQCKRMVCASATLVILTSGVLEWEGPLCASCLRVLSEVVAEVALDEERKVSRILP